MIKEKVEKVKEKEKDMEEEKVVEDQKEKDEVLEEVLEEVMEKEEERKVERVYGRLKVKATKVAKEKVDKELSATSAVSPATSLLSVGRHQVEKEKEKAEKEKYAMFRRQEKRIGTQTHKQVHQRSRKQEQHQQRKEPNKFEDWLQRRCLSLKRLMKMKTM